MFMPRALANSVDQIARRATGKDWNFYAALMAHWPEIVGTDYARVTSPVKVSFPHQPNEARRIRGTLCIRLPKGLSMEFSFRSELVRQRVNTYFGYEAITRITFDPVYEAPPPEGQIKNKDISDESLAKMRKAAQSVEDEALRMALEGFGKAILRSDNRKV